MARVNHKKVKQLIQERRGKISDREFFTSRLLALHFEDIAAAQTKRYGSRRPVRVHLTWEPNAFHAACTNNLTIHINAGNPIITQFPTREKRYQMVRDLVEPKLGPMIVTPKDVDDRVRRLSYVISEGLNIALLGDAYTGA